MAKEECSIHYSVIILIKEPSLGSNLHKFYDGEKYFFAEIQDMSLLFAFKNSKIKKYFYKFYAEIKTYPNGLAVITKVIKRRENRKITKNTIRAYLKLFSLEFYATSIMFLMIAILITFFR